jgi:hypothetical protein
VDPQPPRYIRTCFTPELNFSDHWFLAESATCQISMGLVLAVFSA